MKITNPVRQYFIGLSINLLFLLVLILFESNYGDFLSWPDKDSLTYANPAANFIQYGVFGRFHYPDAFRSIGYQFFISLFMRISADHWLIMMQIVQCFIFASLYPALTLVSETLFKVKSKGIFIFCVASGIFFTRVADVMTDLLFTTLFLWGIYFCILAILRRQWYYLFAYLLLITGAALVRPTLSGFALVNIPLTLAIAHGYKIPFSRVLRPMIISSAIFLFSCNISMIRNYVNYRFLSPSAEIGFNEFYLLGETILIDEGRGAEYETMAKKIDSIDDICLKTKMREQDTKQICLQYPVMAIKVLCINVINQVTDNHLINTIGEHFGYYWKPDEDYKQSMFCYYTTYLFMLIYLAVWVLVAMGILRLLREGNYWLVAFMAVLFVIFILPATVVALGGGSRLRLTFECFVIPVFIKEFLILFKPPKMKGGRTF